MPPSCPDRAELEAAHCWFSVDHVSRDPETTAWKRRARLRQAQWRAARGFEPGHSPYDGSSRKRPASRVGSRLELALAQQGGANFISPEALAAARNRLANPEPREMLSAHRLWADLLSSMPLCFNLFGEADTEPARARSAVDAMCPDAPEGAVRPRFEHSPGRTDITYLGNQSAFDVAFEIDCLNRTGIVGVETKYHEHARPEPTPRKEALTRYAEVTERSGAFVEGWRERLIGTELQQIWQDHLLVLSMLQHDDTPWSWGRFVLLFPEENHSFARVAAEYARSLRDPSTFAWLTIEQLVRSPGVMSDATRRAFEERYCAPAPLR